MRIPKLLTHSRGYFFVRVTDDDGVRRDHILGRDKKAAEKNYKLFVAEYCQRKASPKSMKTVLHVTIERIVVHYLNSIVDRYAPTNSFNDYKKTGELMIRLYGESPVSSFSIPEFRNIIQEMINNNLSKRSINHRIDAIKKIFQHALDCELITAEHYFKIKSVQRIKRDDIRVKPERIVPPVEVDVVNRTLPFFSPMIADMVTVQLHSGMRAGELCRIKWTEIDHSDSPWWYRPEKHKTASKGKKHNIPLGPVCQTVLKPYESSAAGGRLVFNPQISDVELRQYESHEQRT